MKDIEIGFIAGLDSEQRARYYAWGRKYRVFQRTVIVLQILMVGVIALSFGPYSNVRVVRIAFASVVFSFFCSLIAWSVLECPRCGESFRGLGRRQFVDDCRNCGLTLSEVFSIAKTQS